MGLITDILVIALLIFGIYYIYNNWEFETVDICHTEEKTLIPVTCEVQQDCIMYLTSAYSAGYPRTNLFTEILTQVSSCDAGHCYLKSFDFADNKLNKRCEDNEVKVTFQATARDVNALA